MTHDARRFIFFQATLAALLFPVKVFGLSNEAKIPVLLYHSYQLSPPCDYASNASKALEADLEMIKKNGFTIIPLSWIAEWAAGKRDGRSLPKRVVGISFDDGHTYDWNDKSIIKSQCPEAKSFRTVLEKFKNRHADLPPYSPQATIFVIGSPLAREFIGGSTLSDEWWKAANKSRVLRIQNHSADHDHATITKRTYDKELKSYIPIAIEKKSEQAGKNNFMRIDSYKEATLEVVNSANYIKKKTGTQPTLFAYPFGHASTYMREDFFPNHIKRHKTYAAFCIESENKAENYISRKSDRYCLRRFSYGHSWKSPAELQSILNESQ